MIKFLQDQELFKSLSFHHGYELSYMENEHKAAFDHINILITMWDITPKHSKLMSFDEKVSGLKKLLKADPINSTEERVQWFLKINQNYYLLSQSSLGCVVMYQKVSKKFLIFDLCELADLMKLDCKLLRDIKKYLPKDRLKYRIENID